MNRMIETMDFATICIRLGCNLREQVVGVLMFGIDAKRVVVPDVITQVIAYKQEIPEADELLSGYHAYLGNQWKSKRINYHFARVEDEGIPIPRFPWYLGERCKYNPDLRKAITELFTLRIRTESSGQWHCRISGEYDRQLNNPIASMPYAPAPSRRTRPTRTTEE